MKVAFSYSNSRIAPVFDTASEIQLVESSAGQIVNRQQMSLSAALPMQRCQQLVDLGVEALVCGAISKPLHQMVSAYGIQVIPFVAGDLQQVVQGWLENRLGRKEFVMPGCWQGVAAGSRRSRTMNGQGRGRGHGQGRRRQNGESGRTAIGSGDNCRCPACGHEEPHRRGVPCAQQPCPQCGTGMARG